MIKTEKMLKNNLEQQMKEALKAGDQIRLSTLRLLLAAIKNEEIAQSREVTDEDVVTVVRRQMKQRRESVEAFRQAGREELARKEEAELAILNTFVPQQLSEEEIRQIVKEVLDQLPETERNNFGRVMGATMSKVKGKADGNLVAKVVKELLG